MKKRLSVHELRKAGFEVSLAHFRKYHRFDPQTGKKSTALLNPHEKPFQPQYNEYYLSSKGGVTILKLAKDNIESVGSVKCSSADSYVRKVGVVKALGRALQSYNEKAIAAGVQQYKLNFDETCKNSCSTTCSNT